MGATQQPRPSASPCATCQMLQVAVKGKEAEVSALLGELAGWEETAGRLGEALTASEARGDGLAQEAEAARKLVRGYEARLSHAMRSHDGALSQLEELAARQEAQELELSAARADAASWERRAGELSASMGRALEVAESVASALRDERAAAEAEAAEAQVEVSRLRSALALHSAAGQAAPGADLRSAAVETERERELSLLRMLAGGSLCEGERLDGAPASVRQLQSRLTAPRELLAKAESPRRSPDDTRAQALQWQRDVLQGKLARSQEAAGELQRRLSGLEAREAARRGDPTARDAAPGELRRWLLGGVAELHALVGPLRREVSELAAALGLPAGDAEEEELGGGGEEDELLAGMAGQLDARLAAERRVWEEEGALAGLDALALRWAERRSLATAWAGWVRRQRAGRARTLAVAQVQREARRRLCAFHRWRHLSLSSRVELMEAAGEAALVLSKAWGRWRAACGATRLVRQHVGRLQEEARVSHLRMAFHAWQHGISLAAASGSDSRGGATTEEALACAKRHMLRATTAREEAAHLREQLARMAGHVRQLHQEVVQARRCGEEDTAAAEKLAVLVRGLLLRKRGGRGGTAPADTLPLLDLHGAHQHDAEAKQLLALLEIHFGLEVPRPAAAVGSKNAGTRATQSRAKPPPKPVERPSQPVRTAGEDPARPHERLQKPVGSSDAAVSTKAAASAHAARVAASKSTRDAAAAAEDGVLARAPPSRPRPLPVSQPRRQQEEAPMAPASAREQLAAKTAVHLALLRQQRLAAAVAAAQGQTKPAKSTASGEDAAEVGHDVAGGAAEPASSTDKEGMSPQTALAAALLLSQLLPAPPRSSETDLSRRDGSSCTSSSTRREALLRLVARRNFQQARRPERPDSTSISAAATATSPSAKEAADVASSTGSASLCARALSEIAGDNDLSMTFASLMARDAFLQDALDASVALHGAGDQREKHGSVSLIRASGDGVSTRETASIRLTASNSSSTSLPCAISPRESEGSPVVMWYNPSAVMVEGDEPPSPSGVTTDASPTRLTADGGAQLMPALQLFDAAREGNKPERAGGRTMSVMVMCRSPRSAAKMSPLADAMGWSEDMTSSPPAVASASSVPQAARRHKRTSSGTPSVASQHSTLSGTLASWWRAQEAEWDHPTTNGDASLAAADLQVPRPADMEGEVAKVLQQLAVVGLAGNAAVAARGEAPSPLQAPSPAYDCLAPVSTPPPNLGTHPGDPLS
eukprot:jgi/Tetstr1/453761/TSEL_040713.t1